MGFFNKKEGEEKGSVFPKKDFNFSKVNTVTNFFGVDLEKMRPVLDKALKGYVNGVFNWAEMFEMVLADKYIKSNPRAFAVFCFYLGAKTAEFKQSESLSKKLPEGLTSITDFLKSNLEALKKAKIDTDCGEDDCPVHGKLHGRLEDKLKNLKSVKSN